MTDHEIAAAILKQLGGHKFSIMTGAKTVSFGARALTFQLPKNRYFRITLMPDDTYKLEYMILLRRHSLRLHTTNTAIGIHVEQLQSTFTRMTGLDTHL